MEWVQTTESLFTPSINFHFCWMGLHKCKRSKMFCDLVKTCQKHNLHKLLKIKVVKRDTFATLAEHLRVVPFAPGEKKDPKKKTGQPT